MFIRKNLFTRLAQDKRGISAVEYGILIGFVGVALIGTLSTFSGKVNGWFTNVTTKFDTELSSVTSGGGGGGGGGAAP